MIGVLVAGMEEYRASREEEDDDDDG